MKNHSSLYILAALVLSTAALPVFADEARHEEHQANRDQRKADNARTDAVVQELKGHPHRAKMAAKQARHEERRAVRHEDNAAMDR